MAVMREIPPRRLMLAAAVFGLFILFDIFLFGWLIFRSLSQREVEKVLSETRQEAEPLAKAFEKRAEELEELGEDFWVVVSAAQETWSYIETELARREIVRTIEIRDREGTVVYSHSKSEDLPLRTEGAPSLSIEAAEELETPPSQLEVEPIPIGELGTMVIGLDERVVQRRIEELREDLVRQASVIGALTVVLLSAAFGAVWVLYHRSRRLQSQATEAERLAYIGTLASGLAHEIRNPLNSLNLNMQMLAEDARSSDKRLFDITRSELSRLEGLVSDFLTYAKPRPIELADIGASELMERVEEVLRGEVLQLDAELQSHDETGGLAIRVDPAQMTQLLLNLVRNALMAAEDVTRRPIVLIRATLRGGRAILEVIDNGVGIAPEAQDKIFDLFYSTRKGGTGLGLAIVRRIARDHGAEVEVESELGKGTTIRLVLEPTRSRQEVRESTVVTQIRGGS